MSDNDGPLSQSEWLTQESITSRPAHLVLGRIEERPIDGIAPTPGAPMQKHN